jgi:staphylococcal nuclease domain-containing protein 1
MSAPTATAAPAAPTDQQQQPKTGGGVPRAERVPVRGQVKAVLSGDTIVVLVWSKDANAFVERTVSLAGIRAPRLGRIAEPPVIQGNPDEPWAWAAREYLRTKLIGQTVTFTVSGVGGKGREFASVVLGDEDIATSLVREGFALYRPPAGAQAKPRPDVQAMMDLEDEARAAKRGQHQGAVAGSVRPVTPSQTPAALFEKQRGKEVSCVIESVRSGTSMRVLFLPAFIPASVSLAGAVSPSLRYGQGGVIAEAEPYALEARQFTETHVLHREATVTLRAADKQGGIIGTVKLLGRDLGEEIVKAGLAKVVLWAGVKDTPQYSATLEAAQKAAVERKAGMWATTTPSAAPAAASSSGAKAASSAPASTPVTAGVIKGKVVDILNPGVLVVQPQTPGAATVRLALASVRVPRMWREESRTPRPGAPQPPAKPKEEKEKELSRKQQYDNTLWLAGRELLRKNLISAGAVVECHARYERAPQQQQQQQGAEAQAGPQESQSRAYYDVYSAGANVALALVNAGLAEAVQHKGSEPRSQEWSDMCQAEKKAKEAELGVFARAEAATVLSVVDYTVDQTRARSAQVAPFLKNEVDAVVEHVFNATHLKLYIPSQSCYISVMLAGTRSPSRTEKQIYDEAAAYTRSLCLLKDVRIRTDSLDKRGNFLGTVTILAPAAASSAASAPAGSSKKQKKKAAAAATASAAGVPLAVTLVAAGYASVDEQAYKTPLIAELEEAQASAQSKKLKMWGQFDPKAAAAAAASASSSAGKKDAFDAVVTEVLSCEHFYIQRVAEGEALEALSQRLAALAAEPERRALGQRMAKIEAGDVVLAHYSADGNYYRARVLDTPKAGSKTVFVQYIDYGNADTVSRGELMPLPEDVEAIPAYSRKCALAMITFPEQGNESELFKAATDLFKSLTDGGRKLVAAVESVENGILMLSLASEETHINCAIVREGLARVAGRQHHARGVRVDQALLNALRDAETRARTSRVNIWRYGDYGSDDD